jgi:glycine/D-amino acid oxidase-like deaminating enzyme
MIRVDLKPADLGRSGWDAILPGREPQAPLERDIDCDYLVVGAGFAGLSAAWRLRQLDAQARIVILEAHQVASGPAGRNSGFMIDLPHALASGSYGGDDSEDRRNIRMSRAAIAFAGKIARECGFPDEAFDPWLALRTTALMHATSKRSANLLSCSTPARCSASVAAITTRVDCVRPGLQ